MFLEVLLGGKSRYVSNGGLKMWKFSVFQMVDGGSPEFLFQGRVENLGTFGKGNEFSVYLQGDLGILATGERILGILATGGRIRGIFAKGGRNSRCFRKAGNSQYFLRQFLYL